MCFQFVLFLQLQDINMVELLLMQLQKLALVLCARRLYMSGRFPSKLWSCSDLIVGASCVVDEMDNDMEAVKIKQELLGEHEDLSAEEVAKLLKDQGAIMCLFPVGWSCHMSYSSIHLGTKVSEQNILCSGFPGDRRPAGQPLLGGSPR